MLLCSKSPVWGGKHGTQGRSAVPPFTAGARPHAGIRQALLIGTRCLASQAQPVGDSPASCRHGAFRALPPHRVARPHVIICHSSSQPDDQVLEPDDQPDAQAPEPDNQPDAQAPEPDNQPDAQAPEPDNQPDAQAPEPDDQPGAQTPEPDAQPSSPEPLRTDIKQRTRALHQPQQQPAGQPIGTELNVLSKQLFSQGPREDRPRPHRSIYDYWACGQRQDVGIALVQQLQAVRGQLHEASKGLGPIPAKPQAKVSSDLPEGAYIDDDGLMRCSHGLPVQKWVGIRKGPNRGRVYYRCPIADVYHPKLRKVGCFYEYVDEIEVKSAESLPACQRAADVWRRSGADLLRRQRFQIRGQVLRGLLPYQGTFAANAGFEEFIQALGAWGEAYVFLWLQLALPGFDEDCWVSANKRCFDSDAPGVERWLAGQVTYDEPPCDFIWTDDNGVLGTAGTKYYIDAKAESGVAVPAGDDNLREPIHVTANEWQKSKELSEDRSQGTHIFICIDRVDPAFQHLEAPRLAAVLVEPYSMANTLGTICVTDAQPQQGRRTGKLITHYPVQPEVSSTAVPPRQQAAE